MTVLFDPEIGADEFRDRRVTIVGLGKGRTTAGLARFLVGKQARVTITDAAAPATVARRLATPWTASRRLDRSLASITRF